MDVFKTISLSGSLSGTGKKYFSLSEANRSIVLVSRIVRDIVRDYLRLCELHGACKIYDANGDLHQAEIAREQYARSTDHLASLQEELEKIGVDIKDYRLGLVDFPAILDGREVCLCWQLGEDSVAYWHELDAGFSNRQPITSDLH